MAVGLFYNHMNIITAVNHKGIKLIGVGENNDEACRGVLQGALRAKLEQCERTELFMICFTLAHLPDDILELKGVTTGCVEGAEFWRIGLK